jgi:hypothetical protein
MKVRRWLKANSRQRVSIKEDCAALDPCVAPSTCSFADERSYDPGKPLIFMHVPKCCGTSLIQALVAAGIARSAFAGFDGTLFGDFAAFESLSKQLAPFSALPSKVAIDLSAQPQGRGVSMYRL